MKRGLKRLDNHVNEVEERLAGTSQYREMLVENGTRGVRQRPSCNCFNQRSADHRQRMSILHSEQQDTNCRTCSVQESSWSLG